MAGYSTREFLLGGASIAVGASATDTVVSVPFAMSAYDSYDFVVRIKTSATTVTTAITANVQEQWQGAAWEDVGNRAQVSITGNGWFEIQMTRDDANDLAQLPTAPKCRVVVSTGTGDAVTIDSIIVSRRY